MKKYDRLDRRVRVISKLAVFVISVSVRLLRLATPWVTKRHGCTIMDEVAYNVFVGIQFPGLKTGLKIISYDNMLRQGYDYHFDKVISKPCYDKLRREALSRMYKVPVGGVEYNWLASIVDDKPPYGYVVK